MTCWRAGGVTPVMMTTGVSDLALGSQDNDISLALTIIIMDNGLVVS